MCVQHREEIKEEKNISKRKRENGGFLSLSSSPISLFFSLSLCLSLMSASMASLRVLCLFFASSLHLVSSSSNFCTPQSHAFISNLQSQCPLAVVRSEAIEVDGDSLDKALSSSDRNVYTAVLFYASRCPFSRQARETFDVLSSKFPNIRHLAVEQSAAMPSVFSRYGIRSLPSVLMVNQTAKMRYHGSKDFDSLVQFYKKSTGVVPVEYITHDLPSSLENGEKPLLDLMAASSAKEMIIMEPFLLFSILFLSLRAFIYLYPAIVSRLRAFWALYIPHFNLGIFGEASQLLGRVLHMIDVKRVWSKVKLCKARNFHTGAKNARVWASSFASVSLGESSSARLSIGES